MADRERIFYNEKKLNFGSRIGPPLLALFALFLAIFVVWREEIIEEPIQRYIFLVTCLVSLACVFVCEGIYTLRDKSKKRWG